MTKCTVIFEQPKQGKPIEFVKALTAQFTENRNVKPPSFYENVELIASDCYAGLDVMFAYQANREEGLIYFGHWNDGYAE